MDISHVFGRDIAFAPRGDLAKSTGPEQVEQRLLRRLLTNLGAYVWSPEYGAGLPAWVGQPVHVETIRAIVLQQCLLEPDVAHSPAPVVELRQDGPTTLYLRVTYVYGPTGDPQNLNFGLGG